nr:MAG TPA: hypothetical protein [Caudoviricetes sp.]
MKKRNKDFAIIHNTPKGQLLITKEFSSDGYIITLWMDLETAIAKIEITIANKETADKAFEAYRDYEVAKTAVNTALYQEYL